jgi:myo-inositol-hexaphosphate 3-phosphohydrolase
MAQVSFQQGVNDYVGTSDTMLRQYHPSQDYGSATSLSVDSKDPEGNVNQILLRFDHLFGTGLGQIPQDATITSATLTLTTSDPGGGASVHRLLTAWSETATYNSLGDGIQADGTEAVTAADLVTGGIGTLGPITLDVTNSVQAWVDGADNNGWAFLPSSNDGWDFSSSESGQVPVLTVNYTLDPGTPGGEPPGETNIAPVATNDSYSTIAGQALTITTAQGVLANDTDANGDALIALKVSDPIHGTLGLNADGAFSYTPAAGYSGPDSFDYAVRDGHGGTDTATVNLTVSPTTLPPPPPPVDTPFDVTLTPADKTPSVAGSGDRADDPAVVLHPSDLSQSVILGTDKDTGGDGRLYAYNLNGDVIAMASVGQSINNVDVRYQFDLGGTQTAIIGASDRGTDTLVFYTYDFAAHDLQPVGEISSSGADGFALGYVDGQYYAYAVTTGGTVRQYELDGDSGMVTGQLVRTFSVGSQAEGMTADDETGQLYVSEESTGIWRYDASANGGTSRVLVDKVGSGGHLTADVEGLTIYHESDGSGVLIASSQGSDAFEFYDTGTNAWLGQLELEGVTHTDGIDVTNANLGGAYTEGLFVTQVDGVNNFALMSWAGISDATGLPTNSTYDARHDPYIL